MRDIICKGLFTWKEEDPRTRKVLEGGTTFRLVYMQKFRSGWLPRGEGKEEKLSALPAERPAAAMFVRFVPSTRIFRAKVVYMELGSS